MGGGGKGGGGGGAAIPRFVTEAQTEIANRSRQLFDTAQPSLDEGTRQLLSLQRTGGPGANVPIINQAVAGQQGATANTLRQIGQATSRAGLGDLFTNRLQQSVQRQGAAAANRLPSALAVPIVQSGIAAALTGGRQASQGFAGGLRALSSGVRIPRPSASAANAGRNVGNLFNFASGGGFGGGGKGGGGGSSVGGGSFGAGISFT